MNETLLDQHIDGALQRLEALARQAGVALGPSPLLDEALQELSVALEQLGNAAEGLHRQNEELAAARQTVEAEHQRYLALFEFAPDGYLVTDLEGVIQEANRAAAALLHVRQDSLVGKPLLVFVADAQAERRKFHTQLTRLQKGDIESVQDWEVTVQPRGGAPFPASVTISLACDDTGQAIGLRWLMRDMSQRNRVEAIEREQRALAEALRDTAAALNGTLHVDEVLDRILTNVGRIVPYDAVNIMLIDTPSGIARIARSRGYAERGLEGHALAARFPVTEAPNLRRLAESDRPLIIPDTQADPDWPDRPETGWVRSYAGAPIRVKGEIVGFLNLDSVTPHFFTQAHAEHLQAFADQAAIAIENARLYEAIRRDNEELEWRVAERTREISEANRRLVELDRLKDQFVSSVSHELRTPLANIKLYHGLLERGKPDRHEQYLATLQRETARLQTLIESLLTVSRLDIDVIPIHLFPTDLNRLAADLITDRTALAAERDLTLNCIPDPHLPPALVDPDLITVVMSNLITNATNYTPHGGSVTFTTAIHSEADRDSITFTVQDTGPGIPPEEMPHVFERFYRGKAASDLTVPGTGLGLAICKEIVDRLGGRITVESRPGHGAAFTVWLRPASQSVE